MKKQTTLYNLLLNDLELNSVENKDFEIEIIKYGTLDLLYKTTFNKWDCTACDYDFKYMFSYAVTSNKVICTYLNEVK